jgi:pimeloyl-ACP methyl ester carboxylesterase
MKLTSIPMEVVEIPYEGTTLRGYYFRSSEEEEKAPVLIVQQGFDAWIEESLYIALAAMKRGYNCLLFNGPGQGLSVREKNLHFRPDWEAVITPVVDFTLRYPEIDPERIAPLGISMSGALVVRAVAYEHRIKACIANPGYIDIYEAFLGKMPAFLLKIINDHPDTFDKVTQGYLQKSWEFSHALYVFGIDKPSNLVSGSKEYRFRNDLDKIQCDMLIMDGETELVLGAGQAKELYNALKCQKTYLLFKTEEVADLHCQVGALNYANEQLFNWLDEHL